MGAAAWAIYEGLYMVTKSMRISVIPAIVIAGLPHQRDPRIDDRGIDFAKSLQNRTVQSRQCIKDNLQ